MARPARFYLMPLQLNAIMLGGTQPSHSKLMDDLDNAAFGKAIANELRNRGLGNIAKRELEVLLLHLLQKHSSLGAMSNGEAAMVLRAPSTKIRSLRLEVALRYTEDLNGVCPRSS